MTLIANAPAVDELARRIRDAAAARRTLRIVGAGTWIDRLAPVASTETVSAATYGEIVNYVPGDLTITVGAGASLAAIERATREHDQWLTLDPHGSSNGTIGATIATASFGPLATGFGTPRDLVLGLQAVSGTGAVIRGGGRVVKNVAGFDLCRLFTGSRGTLGVITEVTLRLRARPTQDVTVSVAIEPERLATLAATLRAWPFTPMAAELLDSSCAAQIGMAGALTLLLRLGGNPRAVAAQRRAAGTLGTVADAPPDVWERLRSAVDGSPAVVRVTDRPSAFHDRWNDARHIGAESGLVFGSPIIGIVRCACPEFGHGRLAGLREQARAAVSYEALPTAAAWHSLTSDPPSEGLEAGLRAAFDPAGILNQGIMRTAR